MFKFWKKNKEEIEKSNEDVENKNEEVEISNDEISTDLIENEITDESRDLSLEENTHLEISEEYEDEVKVEKFENFVDENFEKEKLVDKKIIEDEIVDVKKDTGIFAKLLAGLTKTKENITGRIDSLLKSYTKIDEDLLEDLEEVLITADVGFNTTVEIIDRLRSSIKEKGIKDPIEVRGLLKEIVEEILSEDSCRIEFDKTPSIVVMVGVNGVGKTTTIGKLAQKYKDKNKKVILAAADTFRAAATEQLDIWSKRVGVDIIKHHEGADPGAVIFDAIKASQARNADVLICDTAGRLHNKTNLMNELGKIFKIIDREYPNAHKEVLLVVDATTGQNAVSQAKTFKEVANITGIVLTKLDGTAKGGVVLAVKSEVDVPVKLIGVGEKVEDLQDFDAKSFSDALFGE